MANSDERKIAPVKNNKDKANTYGAHMSRYKKAIKSECYFEALLISYAMMEDSLRSYLYYLGCLRTRNSYKFDSNKIKNDIKWIIDTYSGDKNPNLGITSITGKMRIVESVQKWYLDGFNNENGSSYLDELAACIDVYENPNELISTLEAVKDWCIYRNEIIHSLLNKNLDSLYSELSERAEEGMILAREIDNHVRRLKSKNSIRKYLKLKEK